MVPTPSAPVLPSAHEAEASARPPALTSGTWGPPCSRTLLSNHLSPLGPAAPLSRLLSLSFLLSHLRPGLAPLPLCSPGAPAFLSSHSAGGAFLGLRHMLELENIWRQLMGLSCMN